MNEERIARVQDRLMAPVFAVLADGDGSFHARGLVVAYSRMTVEWPPGSSRIYAWNGKDKDPSGRRIYRLWQTIL